ncbi:Maf-like protein YceF [Halioglobus japonicus]|nr:Maf-like protein YceF [Halioglobus japonicus]
MDIILASTSPYRKILLERLQLSFSCIPPDIDEAPLPGEAPQAMAERLARAKARAVAQWHPDALVIGSDQVASLEGRIMGKPGNFENAKAQLKMSSGKEVTFYTGVALASQGFERFHVEPFGVRFRALDDTRIANYLKREQPYDCAGSFKVEGLGIALFEQLIGNDPTSLEGLPLITLSSLLAEAGVDVLGR